MFRKAVCLFVITAMTMTVSAVPVDAASFTQAVTGVKAVSTSFDSVKVSCKKKAGAKGYRFYVAKSKNGKYSLAAEAKANRAVISNLTTDKTYYFKVRAFKGSSKKTLTKYSDAVKCAPKLQKPVISSVKISGIFNETVNWNEVAGAKQYKVYRSKYKDKNFKLVGTVEGKSFKGREIKEKTVYYYKVRAFRGKHKSKYSAVKKFTSPPNGNAAKYGLDTVTPVQDEVLNGKNVYFLGSSITEGIASGGVSFVDYLYCQYDIQPWKEAVSSTTMAVCPNALEGESYVERLSRSETGDFVPDVFVCQLSLNDSLSKNNVELGEISDTCRESNEGIDVEQVDTVAEAIEYITVYARENWTNSQIAFFTIKNCGFQKYDDMVRLLLDAQSKWVDDQGRPPFEVLNLWDDPSFMNVKGDTLKLYMRDKYHPTMAGYKKCWLPRMAEFLRTIMPGAYVPEPEPEPQPGGLQVNPLFVPDEPEQEPLTEPEENQSEQAGYEE